ncbi:MAG TPA: hypothetical protein VNV66_02290 [Pilimelia sp.]|nr:hypothetical protein [Pilimelia sp.]
MAIGILRNLVLAGALVVGGVGLAAAPAAAAPQTDRSPVTTQSQRGSLTSTVKGTFTDATGGTGTVTGTFVPTRFAVTDGELLATGTLTATLVDAAGETVGTATETVSLPLVRSASTVDAVAPCNILNLVLGPLDLNLLGLEVHLDQVVLDIVAQSGPGNLLGNLLCAVAGLLDRGGSLYSIAFLLNTILGLLGR